MLCAQCKNENREDAVNCWRCNAPFRNVQGKLINVESCPKCGSLKLEVEKTSAISNFFACIFLCAVGIGVAVEWITWLGLIIFGLGVLSMIYWFFAGVKSVFTNTQIVNIKCTKCNETYDSRRNNVG